MLIVADKENASGTVGAARNRGCLLLVVTAVVTGSLLLLILSDNSGEQSTLESSFVRAVGVNSLEHSTGKVLDSTGFWWGNKKTIPPPHHLLLGAKSKHISSIILCRSGPFFRFRILRADL
jgi:hypothetical protein